MTTTVQRNFIESAVGKYFDPDGVYAFQCVDVAVAYAAACFPEVKWETTFGRGNANMHYPKSNKYFESIPNIVGDLNSFPQYGDIVIWGGDRYNKYGHIAVVVWADAYSMRVLQQNANGTATSPAEISTIGYNQPGTGEVVGWLRPRTGGSVEAPKPPASAGTLNGIDISGHQRGIRVSATGAQFAIVKASEGVGWIDPSLQANVNSVREAGIPLGFYHFARPGAENAASAEAQTFISAVRGYLQGSDVVVLDWESGNTNDVRWAAEWIRIVSAALGRKALIYMNLSEARKPHWAEVQAMSQLWLAQYPSNASQSWGPLNSLPSAPGWSIAIWQYTQTGSLPGYSGALDLNVFYGDIAAWGKLAAGNFTPVTVEQRPSPTPSQCIVEPGDSLSAIAAQFGVSLSDLIAANPGVNPDLIYPGQVLNLPGGVKSTPVAAPSGQVTQCIVEPGDSLSGIAKQFGVDLQKLITLNGIVNAHLIYPGQVLNLPVAAAPAPAPAPSKVTQCIVESGDTVSGIAAQFGVSVARIQAVNPGLNVDLIYPGQVLNL
jgi:LysM repeat protein